MSRVTNRSQPRAEVLAALDGVTWAMAMLLYRVGLRLMECVWLRVKDIECDRNEIVVREGTGNRNRVTILSGAVKDRLLKHLDRVRHLHERDLQAGLGSEVGTRCGEPHRSAGRRSAGRVLASIASYHGRGDATRGGATGQANDEIRLASVSK